MLAGCAGAGTERRAGAAQDVSSETPVRVDTGRRAAPHPHGLDEDGGGAGRPGGSALGSATEALGGETGRWSAGRRARAEVNAYVPHEAEPGTQGAAPRSWLIPAAEIVAFEFLLNQHNRRYVDHHTYGSDGESIRRNLHRGWVIDDDPFRTNQFSHPYGGAIYHGFARSAGHGYWTALAYDFAGSALWEVAGETEPPSLNDQITTTFAGSFLGEALFRKASWVLAGGGRRPGLARSTLATLIAPSAAVNRYLYADRFETVHPDDHPATASWVGIGARRNVRLNDLDVLDDTHRNQAVAAVSVDYGLPGAAGYAYDEPFDYFHLAATATTSRNAIPENLTVRGLLLGEDYRAGEDVHGIWGLYGSYDYFSPEIFRVSSTGLSLGTTAEAALTDGLTLQGTCLLGAGFTAAGTTASRDRDREYRYGASPQGLLALRLLWDDVAMLEVAAHGYRITGERGSPGTEGSEDILRAQVSLVFRVTGRHGVGVQFVESSRDPRFSRQSVGALGVFYTFLGDERFGAVRR